MILLLYLVYVNKYLRFLNGVIFNFLLDDIPKVCDKYNI